MSHSLDNRLQADTEPQRQTVTPQHSGKAMTSVCCGKIVVSWQITYSGDDSGVKLDISSGVGTAQARTAKEKEKRNR